MLQCSSILGFYPVSVSLEIRQDMPTFRLSVWFVKKLSALKRKLLGQQGSNNAKHKTLKNENKTSSWTEYMQVNPHELKI